MLLAFSVVGAGVSTLARLLPRCLGGGGGGGAVPPSFSLLTFLPVPGPLPASILLTLGGRLVLADRAGGGGGGDNLGRPSLLVVMVAKPARLSTCPPLLMELNPVPVGLRSLSPTFCTAVGVDVKVP